MPKTMTPDNWGDKMLEEARVHDSDGDAHYCFTAIARQIRAQALDDARAAVIGVRGLIPASDAAVLGFARTAIDALMETE